LTLRATADFGAAVIFDTDSLVGPSTAGTQHRTRSRTRQAATRWLTRFEHPGTQETYHMADTVKDPVCGMDIRPQDAVAQEEHDGRTFYFCSHACRDTFLKDPHRYGHPTANSGGQGHH